MFQARMPEPTAIMIDARASISQVSMSLTPVAGRMARGCSLISSLAPATASLRG